MNHTKTDWLYWAEHWSEIEGGEEAMWRCLLRWVSGIEFYD